MKGQSILFLTIIIIAGFIGRNALAQNAPQLLDHVKTPALITAEKPGNLRTSASGKPPLISYNYFPDATGANVWKLETISDYKYDSLNRIVSGIHREVGSNQILGKDSSAYDAYGFRIFKASYIPNPSTNSWELFGGERYILTYNPSGKITSKTYERFDTVWKKISRDYYTYDAANRLTEYYSQSWWNNNWSTSEYKRTYSYNPDSTIAGAVIYWLNRQNNQWRLSSRETYSYNQGTKKLSEIFKENYHVSSGVWLTASRDRYLSWQNDKLTHFQVQVWNGMINSWENGYNELTTYDSLGGHSSLSQYWQNNGWVNSQRDAFLFDSKFNDSGFKWEEWVNNNWKIKREYTKTHTYDAQDNILETVALEWDPQLNAMKNWYRHIFYYTQPGSNPNTPLKIAPNPTSGVLHIELGNQPSAKVSLTNLTGHIVKTETLTSANPRIDISTVPKGLYLLTIQTEKGSQTSKIVKL